MKKIVKTKEITVIKPAAKKFNLQAFFYILNKPIVIFGLTLILGIIIAFSLGFWYSSVKDKIFAEDTLRDTLTYQGKIVNADGVPPADGLYNMRFKIYNQDTSGLLLWTETWDGTNQGTSGSKVTVNSGVFTVELNSLCGNWVGTCASNAGVTFATPNFYLQVELDFDGDGVDYEETFLPRKRFTATPFSMNADKLDGRDATDFLLKSGGEDAVLGSVTVDQILDNSLVAYLQFANYTSPGAYYLTYDSGPNNLAAETYYTAPSEGVLPLNGTDAYGQIDDVDDLSFGTGTLDTPFSLSAWIQPVDATNFVIVSKGLYNTNAEYKFYIDENDKVSLQLFDESVDNAYIGRMYQAESLDGYQSNWIQLTATYNGNGASDGIKLYLNGLPVDDADRESGSYVAMENLSADLHIGRYNSTYANGRIDDLMIFNRALSASEVQSLYSGSQYKANLNAYQTKAMYLVLTGIDGANFEDSYMYYDGISNQIISDQKMLIPDNMPAVDNAKNDRDYTHFVDDNKILAYDFSDPINGILDLEGNSNGNFNSDYPFVNSGFFGYGFYMNNATDYITFTNPGVSTTSGSIEMWARLNNISTSETNYLAYFSVSSTTSLELVKTGTSDLKAKVGNADLTDTGFDIPDNNWHHYALTYNSGGYEVFVDGVSVATGTYSSPITAPTTLLLGYGNAADTSLNGYLDSVAIYNDVLTDAEIMNHANFGFGTLYANSFNLSGTSFQYEKFLAPFEQMSNINLINDPGNFGESKAFGLTFQEGQGTTTTTTGTTFTPTITGAKWANGYYGYGLYFDGDNDYVQLNDDNALDITTEDFAIEFWLKCKSGDNPSGKRIISKVDGSGVGYEVYFGSNDKLQIAINDGVNTPFVSSATAWGVCNDKWKYIAIIFDRSDVVKIYMDIWPALGPDGNGESISGVSGSLANAASLYVGGNSTGDGFKGTLDNVLMHKYDPTTDLLFNFYDIASRFFRSPEMFLVANRNVTGAEYAASYLLNLSDAGFGAMVGLMNPDNTGGFPLGIMSDSAASGIYNLIYFGSSASGYGNLMWDSGNNRFILDKSLSVEGNLQVSGELSGTRQMFTAGRQTTYSFSGYPMVGVGGTLSMSGMEGFRAMRAGSITGLAANFYISSLTTQGDITVQARVNDTPVYNLIINSGDTTGSVSGVTTQARGIDAFSAGDLLTFYVLYETPDTPFVGSAKWILEMEVTYDN